MTLTETIVRLRELKAKAEAPHPDGMTAHYRAVDEYQAEAMLALDALLDAAERAERLRALDHEAAEHVESVICMRTGFTGDHPYVGWKGLGLALNEALDERDRLRERVAALEAGLLGLVEQLDRVHGSDAYRAVWTLNQLHNGRYTGPAYTAELAAARALLTPDGVGGADGAPSVPLPIVSGLTLSDLRRAAVERQAEWCPDEQPDLSFRGNELAGETGEACNVIKKLERERHGWRGSRATVGQLAEELADVVICADLAALAAGIDLEEAVRAKFNATSAKNNLATRLATRPGASHD